MAGFYYDQRQERRISDVFLFCGLWITVPVFIIELSYLGATLAFPYQDTFLRHIDTTFGFDWTAWAHYAKHYAGVGALVYSLHYPQPFIAVIILALSAGDNVRFFLSGLIAMSLTIAIASLMPALGPGTIEGFPYKVPEIVESIRAGQRDLPYAGIVWFPSFHTTMAILFTEVYWGRWWAFWPALALNLAMLLSIPFSGNHYLTDMIGGAVVAGLSLAIVSLIRPKPARANLTPLDSSAQQQPAARPDRQCGGKPADHPLGQQFER